MDRLEAALKTHPGLKRPKNEDAVGGEATPWGGVYVVADGMGGHRTGEVASRLAVETVLARLSREEPPSPKDLLEALEEANGRIHREAQRPENRGMGTTCTVLVLDLPYALVAHVGDSRAYLLREGNLLQLTEDHSWVAERLKEGVLTRTEAERHPYRNVLTRALGLPEARFDLVEVRLAPGEGVLLVTDGLYGHVPEEEWRLGRDLQASLEAMVAEALRRGGDDNVTAVALRVE